MNGLNLKGMHNTVGSYITSVRGANSLNLKGIHNRKDEQYFMEQVRTISI